MVVSIKTHLRPAIAMIELIFAIVVMGITMLSAPLILNMSIQSSNTAMQQESIAAAASELSLILTHPWDEGNTLDTTGYGILRVSNGDGDLNATNRLRYDRRFNFTTPGLEANASLPDTFGNGSDSIADNDIDDFHGTARTITLYSNSEVSILSDNEGEYLKNQDGTSGLFTINTTVSYGDDNATYTSGNIVFSNPFKPAVGNTSTNIKLIQVSLTNDTGALEHNQTVSLSAFACNIGDASLTPISMP